MAEAAGRRYAASVYREVRRLLRRLPPGDGRRAAGEASAAAAARRWAAAAAAGEEEQRLAEVKALVGQLGFLRTVTPKRPGDGAGPANPGGTTTFVLREGRLVPGHGEERGAGAAHRDLPSEADLATRQRALTKRQFFGKDPPKNMHWDFL